MATITGSTNQDWSGVPFDPVNFETDILQFRDRMTQALTEVGNGQFFLISVNAPFFTQASFGLFSGGTINIIGSNLNNPDTAVFTSVTFNHPDGQILRMQGTMDGIGNDSLHTVTITNTDGTIETARGAFTLAFSGAFLGGKVSSLAVASDGFTTTISGVAPGGAASSSTLSVNGSGNISGTIKGLKIVGPGGDVIDIQGLALAYDATLASVTTADELFSVIGAGLASNDSINYNSTVGQALYSGAGNDTISAGGAGIDTLVGGIGNDTYVFLATSGDDVITENPGEGTDSVHIAINAPVDFSMAGPRFDNVENAVVTGTGTANVIGNVADNVITGNNSINVLEGGEGNDSILGLAGTDFLSGDAGNDTLNGGLGIDTMNGGDGDDIVLIGSGEHPLGEAIDGGVGSDTIRFTATTAQTLTLQNVTNVENVAIANAAGIATATTALHVNASSLTESVKLTGNAGGNILIAGSGNDTLIGGAGVDNLQGGAGDDRIELGLVSHFAAGEVINGGAGEDSLIFAGVIPGTLTLTNKFVGMELVEIAGTAAVNVNATTVANGLRMFGNDSANALTGTASADTLVGGGGNDSITGGAGVDDLQGGDGDDSFLYASAAHLSGSETVNGGADTDTVHFTAASTTGNPTLTLGANFTDIEKVVIGTPAGTVALNINAALAPNGLSITGNGGKNSLTGTAFGDTLIGGGGNDTLDGNIGQDTLNGGTGADNVDGGDDGDIVLVPSAAEYAGDAVNGGAGFDTLRFTSTTNAATLVLNANFVQMEQVWIADASGDFSGTVAINVNASLASSALEIIGNDGANSITGTAFADNLRGAGGNDVFLIGTGSHHTADEGIDGDTGDLNVIRFTRATGTDTLTLSALISNIAEVEASDAAGGNLGTAALNIDASDVLNGLKITGNNGNNVLTGTNENDSIAGNAGNDTLIGGDGQDTLVGGLGADWVSYANSPAGASVHLGLGTAFDGFGFGDTLIGIENASGSDNNDTFNGGVGNNVFDGGIGNDSMEGREGNDTLIGGAGEDIMNGEGGNDVFLIDAAADHLGVETVHGGNGLEIDVVRFTSNTPGDELELTSNVTAVEQVVIGNAAGSTIGVTALHVNASQVGNSLSITGNNGANSILGTAQNDTIIGNSGDDTLTGGAGNDVLNGGVGTDTADYSGAVGSVVANLLAGTAQDGGGFTDNLVAIENLAGSANNDTLTGNAGNNVLTGGAGVDSLTGGLGNDRLVMEVGSPDDADGGAGVDTLVLVGLVGGDNLVTINLGAVGDQLANMAEGLEPRLQNNFENIDASGLTGGGRIQATGSAGANIFVGASGTDVMTGGAGNDAYTVQSNADQVNELPDGGTDTVFHQNISGSYDLAANVEHLMILGWTSGFASGNDLNNTISDNTAQSIALFGNGGADMLIGGGGNNTLTGGAGADTLSGGLGNDQYMLSVSDLADRIIEAVNQGTIDAIQVSGDGTVVITYTLPANVENLFMNNMGDKTGTLVGNALDNVLSTGGEGGAFVLDGGAGNDSLSGAEMDDTLVGGAGNDTLVAGLGNDMLTGGTGVDSMLGGAGNDLFLFGALAEIPVTEVVDGGADTDVLRYTGGAATLTLGSLAGQINLTSIEAIQVAGPTGAITGTATINVNAANHAGPLAITGNNGMNTLTGTAANDSLTGNSGNDVLVGGAGDDFINGGAGNDIFLLGEGEHTAPETIIGGAGTDLVRFTSTTGNDTLTLTAVEVEQVVISSATGVITGVTQLNVNATGADNLLLIAGNNGANTLTGNGLNNTINGNGGTDNLIGNAGNDTLSGGAENDTLTGGEGTDRLVGGLGNDRYQLGLADLPDMLVEAVGQGTDEVDFNSGYNGPLDGNLSYNLAANIENASITNLGDFAGTLNGNALNNLLLGNGEGVGTFLFNGGDGNDQLTVNGNNTGTDTLNGGAGNDTISGGEGQDSVNGGVGNDRIVMHVSAGNIDNADGGTGTDTLALFDSLVGGQVVADLALADQISQIGEGLGNDGVLQQAGFEHIDASGMTGGNLIATGNDLANHLIGTGVGDTLTGGVGNDTLEGGAGNDSLNGGAGIDSLDGGAGNDQMAGGSGNDTYSVSQEGETVTEAPGAAEGVDTVIQQNMTYDYTLADNVENLTIMASETGWTASGNNLNNFIQDKSGSGLILIGGTGKDTLVGGVGNDTYVLDVTNGVTVATGDLGDVLVEAAGQGTDTVNLTGDDSLAALTFIVPNHVENVSVSSSLGILPVTLTGNALDNVLGAESMVGGSAAFLFGGVGNDTLRGGQGDDSLNGGAGNDPMFGGLGNDTLNGGAGIDGMIGQEGDDTFVIVSGAEHLGTESMNGGADFDVIRFISGVNGDKLILTNNVVDVEQVVIVTPAGSAAGTTALEVNAAAAADALEIIGNNGVNKLTGTAFDDSLTGNGGNDILIGGAGNDTLLGGAGADNLQGGIDNDVIRLAAATEFIVGELINGGDGDDILQILSNAQSLNLTTIANDRIVNIEAIDLEGSACSVTLNVADVLDISFSTNTLRVDGDATNTVTSTGQGWTLGAEQLAGYTTYTFGAATLLIDTDITQNIS